MNPSGTPDKNLLDIDPALSGAPGNPAVLRFSVLDASVTDAAGNRIYTGALKITNGCHDMVIYVERIIGGKETHVDINHGAQRIKVICGAFENRSSEYISSIKGGCEDCSITGPVFGPLPSKAVHHIDGNWSDQSSAITKGSQLGYTFADGSPALCQQLNSAGITALPPATVKCTLAIPCGLLGIAVVWTAWGLLKKLKLA